MEVVWKTTPLHIHQNHVSIVSSLPRNLQIPSPPPKAFYEECIAPSASTLRQLSVHVVGKAHQAELSADAGEGVTLLSDPSSLHQRLPLADLEATDPGAPMGVPAAGPQSDAPAAKRLKGA